MILNSKTNEMVHRGSALIEGHYLPCIEYFARLSAFSEIVVEKYEHYQKQTYRNRCLILGPHRVETLIIPVIGTGKKQVIEDIKIDYGQRWVDNHWRTIQTAYGNAPYYEYYMDDLKTTLFSKPAYLFDLNFLLLTMCLQWLGQRPDVKQTASYEKSPAAWVEDLRGVINPKKAGNCNRIFKCSEYHQVFGSKFVSNLSIIDLIFNQGPGAWEVIKASAQSEQ